MQDFKVIKKNRSSLWLDYFGFLVEPKTKMNKWFLSLPKLKLN